MSLVLVQRLIVSKLQKLCCCLFATDIQNNLSVINQSLYQYIPKMSYSTGLDFIHCMKMLTVNLCCCLFATDIQNNLSVINQSLYQYIPKMSYSTGLDFIHCMKMLTVNLYISFFEL